MFKKVLIKIGFERTLYISDCHFLGNMTVTSTAFYKKIIKTKKTAHSLSSVLKARALKLK